MSTIIFFHFQSEIHKVFSFEISSHVNLATIWSKICYHVANTSWNQTIFNNKTYFSYHTMKKNEREHTRLCHWTGNCKLQPLSEKQYVLS